MTRALSMPPTRRRVTSPTRRPPHRYLQEQSYAGHDPAAIAVRKAADLDKCDQKRLHVIGRRRLRQPLQQPVKTLAARNMAALAMTTGIAGAYVVDHALAQRRVRARVDRSDAVETRAGAPLAFVVEVLEVEGLSVMRSLLMKFSTSISGAPSQRRDH